MLALTVKEYPKTRVKILLPSGETIYMYWKHRNSKQALLMFEAPKDIKIKREYSTDHDRATDRTDANSLDWREGTYEREDERSTKRTIQKYMQLEDEHN